MVSWTFKHSINLYIVILDDLTLKTAAPLGSVNKICIVLYLWKRIELHCFRDLILVLGDGFLPSGVIQMYTIIPGKILTKVFGSKVM